MLLLDFIFDWIFPNYCSGCGKEKTPLCADCLQRIELAEVSPHPNISSLFSYRDKRVRRALWRLKYKGTKEVAEILGKALNEYLLDELSELALLENFTEPVVVPVPLTSKRLRERGYNQAELLGRCLTYPLLSDVLIKIKETKSQVSIKNREERLMNLKGAFSVINSEKIENKNIILIDDVTTTGATLKECMKVLKAAGVRKVIAATVAH